MKKYILNLLFLHSIISYAQPTTKFGDYFGEKPGNKVTLFAPNFISTEYNELNAAFSSDGNEFYFTICDYSNLYYTIMYCNKVKDKWISPQVAPFSGCYSDADPFFHLMENEFILFLKDL